MVLLNNKEFEALFRRRAKFANEQLRPVPSTFVFEQTRLLGRRAVVAVSIPRRSEKELED